jgi:hypothetical protein
MAEKLRTWFSMTTTELFRAAVNKVILANIWKRREEEDLIFNVA